MYAKNPTGLGQDEISSNKFRSHSTSSPALSKEINLDSIVEQAKHVFLDDFKEIVPLQSVNT